MAIRNYLALAGLAAACSAGIAGVVAAQNASQPTFSERGYRLTSPRFITTGPRYDYQNELFAFTWSRQSRYVDKKLQAAIERNDYAYLLAHYQKKCSAADLPTDTAIDDYNASGKGVGNCHYLAELYFQGLGVDKDIPKAIGYYQIAADGGFWPSVEFLASAYLKGVDVARDTDKAVFLLTRFTTKPKTSTSLTCISALHLASLYQTGVYLQPDGVTAAKWYQHCVDRVPLRAVPPPEAVRAMTHLANLYDDGALVPADPARAAKLYLQVLAVPKVAKADRANAQFRLGRMYVAGSGVTKDVRHGMDLLLAAADVNQPDAPLLLYKLYAAGKEVAANPALAARYLRQAADLDVLEAQYLMGRQALTSNPPDLKEAKAWFESAGAQGYAEAQYDLGQFYVDYPDNPLTAPLYAWVWFDLASQNNHALAAAARDAAQGRLSAAELEKAKYIEANLKIKFPEIAPPQ